jgi:phage shock protein C
MDENTDRPNTSSPPPTAAAPGTATATDPTQPGSRTATAGTLSGLRPRRSRTDRMIAGVCGGLAESLGVDAVILRLALVLATVLGIGAGVVLYLVCWILMPLEPEHEPAPFATSDLVPPASHTP